MVPWISHQPSLGRIGHTQLSGLIYTWLKTISTFLRTGFGSQDNHETKSGESGQQIMGLLFELYCPHPGLSKKYAPKLTAVGSFWGIRKEQPARGWGQCSGSRAKKWREGHIFWALDKALPEGPFICTTQYIPCFVWDSLGQAFCAFSPCRSVMRLNDLIYVKCLELWCTWHPLDYGCRSSRHSPSYMIHKSSVYLVRLWWSQQLLFHSPFLCDSNHSWISPLHPHPTFFPFSCPLPHHFIFPFSPFLKPEVVCGCRI